MGRTSSWALPAGEGLGRSSYQRYWDGDCAFSFAHASENGSWVLLCSCCVPALSAYFYSRAEDWDCAHELPSLGASHRAVIGIPWCMVHICLAAC